MDVGRRDGQRRSPSRSPGDRFDVTCADGVDDTDIGDHVANVRTTPAIRSVTVRLVTVRSVTVRSVTGSAGDGRPVRDWTIERIGAGAAGAVQAVVLKVIEFMSQRCASR